MWTNLMLLAGLGGLGLIAVTIERWLARTELAAVNHQYEVLCEQMSTVRSPHD
jgi:hypothetical protein